MTLEYLPLIMLRALAITIIIEEIFAWIVRIRGKENQIIIVCANLMTNPLVVSIGAAIRFFLNIEFFYPLTIILEIITVFVEGVIYNKFLKCKGNPFVISLILNMASYSIGELINNYIL